MTIELQHISYTYPKSATPAVADFSATFPRGRVTALTGANGCGKTTLSKLLVGVLQPDQGRILAGGRELTGLDLFTVGKEIGYLWQNPNRQLFCATVGEELAFGLRNQGLTEARIAEESRRWLEYFHLEHLKEAHPFLLSLGEKQRLALACVLSIGAPRLVLDEPTGGLDIRSRRLLGQELRQLAEAGCGLIIVSHETDFIRRYADGEVRMC